MLIISVVVDTTKVRFFKQITTRPRIGIFLTWLLLTPQRYDFSSKSQLAYKLEQLNKCCCWHHKGTIFQANHNCHWVMITNVTVVVDTTKVRFFKQITTAFLDNKTIHCCCWHHKGTIFQANHNCARIRTYSTCVVVDTTKVRFFKQITTGDSIKKDFYGLLLTPQRYDFSSKSQQRQSSTSLMKGCCWHHKGTIFQANHNTW